MIPSRLGLVTADASENKNLTRRTKQEIEMPSLFINRAVQAANKHNVQIIRGQVRPGMSLPSTRQMPLTTKNMKVSIIGLSMPRE